MSDIIKRRNLIRQMSERSKSTNLTSMEKLSKPSKDNENIELNIFDFKETELDQFLSLDHYLNIDTEIDKEKIIAEIDEIRSRFDKENSRQFFNQSRDQLIGVIANKFMIGGIISNWDQDGGNVDTIHNVRIKDENGNLKFASEEMNIAYQQRGAYDPNEYHKHKDFIARNKQFSDQKKKGSLHDAYTGEKFAPNANVDLDHTISANEIHNDPGRILAGKKGPELANKESNLNPTERSINRSKKAASSEEFLKRLKDQEPERLAKMEALKSKESLTDKERKTLEKYEKLQKVDEDKVNELDKKARKEYEAALNKEYYLSKDFLGHVGKTSVQEGMKMGLQQVVGLFLTETITAVFDEVRDVAKKGLKKGKTFSEDLKERLERVVKRITSKWKEALAQGFSGFVSGIFSNIVTVVINAVVSTAKNVVRLIREGFFSIVKAVKMLINPPQGMTKAQAFDEAGKIIIAALAVSLGILMEEALDKYPPAQLIKSIPVIGELLYSTLFGFLTGLVTALGLWGWDKLDLFGVKEHSRHEFVMEVLNQDHKKVIEERKQWLNKIKERNPERYSLLAQELKLS